MSQDLQIFRTLEDSLEKSIQKLILVYKKNGKEIVSKSSEKIHLPESSLFKAYYKMILRHEEEYQLYLKKLDFDKKINTYKYEIENAYFEYIKNYDKIKDFLQEHLVDIVKKNTSRLTLRYLDKLNKEILKKIVIDINSEFNNYYIILEELKEKTRVVYTRTSVLLHMAYQEKTYIRKIEYSKLEKLDFKDLKKGDIILFDEYEKYKSSLARRQIKFWSKSTILHSAIFISLHDQKPLIYEAAGVNRKKTYIAPLFLEKGVRYIILRPRKNIGKLEQEAIEQEVIQMIEKKFGIIKLYGIAINYTLLKFYKSFFPFITSGRNIYFGKGVFCSETVSIIYKNFGVGVSNNEDFAMISPVDILNSYNLDNIGYLEKTD